MCTVHRYMMCFTEIGFIACWCFFFSHVMLFLHFFCCSIHFFRLFLSISLPLCRENLCCFVCVIIWCIHVMSFCRFFIFILLARKYILLAAPFHYNRYGIVHCVCLCVPKLVASYRRVCVCLCVVGGIKRINVRHYSSNNTSQNKPQCHKKNKTNKFSELCWAESFQRMLRTFSPLSHVVFLLISLVYSFFPRLLLLFLLFFSAHEI